MNKARLVDAHGTRFVEVPTDAPLVRRFTKEQLERIIAERNRNIDRMTVERDYYQGLLSMYEGRK